MLNTPDYKQKLRNAIEGGGDKANDENSTPSMISTSTVVSDDVSALTMEPASRVTSTTTTTTQNTSNKSEADAVIENDEEEERRQQKPPATTTSSENTDTGALLQAGSIAAGVLGLGLMMAFGNGGGDKNNKNNNKKK